MGDEDIAPMRELRTSEATILSMRPPKSDICDLDSPRNRFVMSQRRGIRTLPHRRSKLIKLVLKSGTNYHWRENRFKPARALLPNSHRGIRTPSASDDQRREEKFPPIGISYANGFR